MNANTPSPFHSVHFYVGLAQAVLWAVLGVGVIRLVFSFVKIFEDFDAVLPAMTVLVISLAFFLANYWYLALYVLALWPFLNWGFVLLLSSVFPKPSLPKWLWYGITWSVPFLIVGMVVGALFLPLISLIEQLS